ncbi:MucR family transcriptional regulator [Aureimonas populi]|uniref:MucR family transcriptional regulator n=1 Tax=Aureimonas populi TaxID=1701758 RepID=A0ABW5CGX9_9HYPH|nr:MucR family transcriptional regulator [Aureimonas populi]
MSEVEKPNLTALTVQLLSAYVGNNAVPSGELADLIRSTRAALDEEAKPAAPAEPAHVPAVSVRASLASRDHILSMIDGKPYKSLKRHLSSHGLTPVEYRGRYNLPRDYPMVAQSYSEQRREVAKRLGLGRKPTEAVSDTVSNVAPEGAPEAAPAAPKRAKSSAQGAKREGRAARAPKAKPAQPVE